MSKKQVISTNESMKPTGPYSQGVVYDSLVFVAGQTGINPSTGQLVEGGIEAETRQTLANVKAILESGGSSLDKVLKVNVYLKDINDFDTVNNIYKEYFTEEYPIRTCLQVVAMPKGACIEIEAIAHK
ncbi:Rid family detoxifying hydrolase [Alkaliphilus sp. B6464]|uniref:Rid family detoxifying hydrolase n=1 Tax=Alkaliphilus sp. B6464 TaxID=2731219 RepID=UPI001BA83182|nr:Rid family detoxifying hydrolase [Alkaliphilus sp. B6464]QUH20354.1 hypothetical protein HYG84_10895 [Alkaliphilus sp. B6464]